MSLYPSNALAVMFSYQPPNDETSPKYAAVSAAYAAFTKDLTNIFGDLGQMEDTQCVIDNDAYVTLHARVNVATLAYAVVINENHNPLYPAQAWALQAIDCVILARMWAHKGVRAADGPMRGRFLSLARTESEKAQLLINANIALAGPVAAAYTPGG